jgi:hypothetical protein
MLIFYVSLISQAAGKCLPPVSIFQHLTLKYLTPQIIVKFSPADCVFIRQLLNSEHTKLASMHLSHRGQISYYIYYTILKKNMTSVIQTMILMHFIHGYPKYLQNRPGPKCETIPCNFSVRFLACNQNIKHDARRLIFSLRSSAGKYN